MRAPTPEEINDALAATAQEPKDVMGSVISAMRLSNQNEVIEKVVDGLYMRTVHPLAMLRGYMAAAIVAGMKIASERGEKLPPSWNFDLPTQDQFQEFCENTSAKANNPELVEHCSRLVTSEYAKHLIASITKMTVQTNGSLTHNLLMNGMVIGILWSQTAAMRRMEVAE